MCQILGITCEANNGTATVFSDVLVSKSNCLNQTSDFKLIFFKVLIMLITFNYLNK